MSEVAEAKVKIAKGSGEWVICTERSALNLRDKSLDHVIVTGRRFETVKPFEGWGDNKIKREIRGKEYEFIRVQLPRFEDEDHEGIGYMALGYLKLRTECAGADRANGHGKDVENTDDGPKEKLPAGMLTGVFPIDHSPKRDYETGGRSFGYARNGGKRKHAANDLIGSGKTKVIAVDDGVILRGPYYFYSNTYAVEVKHSTGQVVRYGEVAGSLTSGLGTKSKVRKGQVIGRLGVNSAGSAMLHFELYKGTQSGRLTDRSRAGYQRRADLVSPTTLLKRLETNSGL